MLLSMCCCVFLEFVFAVCIGVVWCDGSVCWVLLWCCGFAYLSLCSVWFMLVLVWCVDCVLVCVGVM